MFPVYDKIAFCIDGSVGGQLDVEGEEHDDLSSIFFTQRQWEQIWAEITYPENPFVTKSVNITYSRTAHVYVKPSILDVIKNQLKGRVGCGENVCIVMDDLKSLLASGDNYDTETFIFLKTLQDELSWEVEDIMFHTDV